MVATGLREQRRLWAIRERVAESVKHRCPYKEVDAVVPRGALTELVNGAREIARRHSVQAVCYGHAGDGNLHINLLREELSDEEWSARRDAAEGDLLARVVALGGSITGEHGVGWTQRRYLTLAHSAPILDMMLALKKSWDPLGILNPGKIFPDSARPERMNR